MRIAPSIFASVLVSLGCSGAADVDPRPADEAGATSDAATDVEVDSSPKTSFRIASPSDGAEIVGTALVSVESEGHFLARVVFSRDGTTACEDDRAPWSCAVDLSTLAPGATATVVAKGLDGAGKEVASASVTLKKRSMFADICKDAAGKDTPLPECLAKLHEEKKAAGNVGDSYDNLDGDHTALNVKAHPQVKYLRSGMGSFVIGTVDAHKDDAPLVGNASLCSTIGSECFGQVRTIVYYNRTKLHYDLYRKNKLFWFPEHRDHDEIDKAHYMLPFIPSSQGSSGSEMDEVSKFFWTLAAFTPEVKTKLAQKGALLPAVVMIHRRTRVASDAEYLSGKAHANAFDDNANSHAMVRMAHAMKVDELPPVALVSVESETWDAPEQAFATPASIARKWLGKTDTPRKMTVSAKASESFNGRALHYQWVVVRGDASKVKIAPKADDGSVVEIEIPHHAEETLDIGGAPRKTKLVVVGLFVHDGAHWSAPAFVTSYAEK